MYETNYDDRCLFYFRVKADLILKITREAYVSEKAETVLSKMNF